MGIDPTPKLPRLTPAHRFNTTLSEALGTASRYATMAGGLCLIRGGHPRILRQTSAGADPTYTCGVCYARLL